MPTVPSMYGLKSIIDFNVDKLCLNHFFRNEPHLRNVILSILSCFRLQQYSVMLGISRSPFSVFPPSPLHFHSVHCIFSSGITSRNYRAEIMELIGSDSSSLTLTIGEEAVRRVSLFRLLSHRSEKREIVWNKEGDLFQLF